MLGRVYDEPKDDGRNYIEHKYDDYKDVYNQLTPKKVLGKQTSVSRI